MITGIGAQLRLPYGPLVNEPLPQEFVELLARLDESAGQEKQNDG